MWQFMQKVNSLDEGLFDFIKIEQLCTVMQLKQKKCQISFQIINLNYIGKKEAYFDTENFEVIWFEAPLEERKHLFFTDVPQVNNEVLGVMDSENNLRVYERN